MIWRTDTPTESPIVAYLEGSNIPEVLLLAKEPYPHYYDSAGEEIPTGMIQKWASLSDGKTVEGYVSIRGKRSLITVTDNLKEFKYGDEVIVQIQKKQ